MLQVIPRHAHEGTGQRSRQGKGASMWRTTPMAKFKGARETEGVRILEELRGGPDHLAIDREHPELPPAEMRCRSGIRLTFSPDALFSPLARLGSSPLPPKLAGSAPVLKQSADAATGQARIWKEAIR